MRYLQTLLLAFLLLAPSLAQIRVEESSFQYGRGKKSIPLTVVYPQNYSKTKQYPVIIALPPGAGNQQMVQATLGSYWGSQGARRGYIVISPAIFGRDLDRDAGAFSDALFRWMDKNVSYKRRNVGLVGQSNGGIGTFFLAAARPRRFKALLVIPGQYLGDKRRLSPLRGKPIWMLMGEKDDPQRWVAPTKETFASLKKVGARVKLDILPGQGHVPRVSPAKLFDWLDKTVKR